MESSEERTMPIQGLFAGQKVEHYENASYRTLRQFAKTLGLSEAVSLFIATLNEEKADDKNYKQLLNQLMLKQK